MLQTNQMSDLDGAARDLHNQKLLLDTMVDTQVILQILVEKEIVTREEVAEMRDVVKRAPKYRDAYTYIQQTAEEIKKYKDDPQALLREMLNRKLNK